MIGNCSVLPADNIWNGLRWKVYTELFVPANAASALKNKNTINIGFDARHYLKIYRNFIWAVRGAGDFSFGDARLIYYLGGEDGWVFPKFNVLAADTKVPYAFQTLALNLRGFNQNAANGSNNVVINSEFRLPVFTTFLSSPINNAFIRNFQLVQFFDLGTAWSGPLSAIKRPTIIYHQYIDTNGDGVPDIISPLDVEIKAHDRGVSIEFSDSGTGIREPEHVFEPFYTTKPVGQGTGLGLDISRRIIMDHHHGEISVESVPGRTVMRVRLPVR
jgi:hypothetical protein